MVNIMPEDTKSVKPGIQISRFKLQCSKLKLPVQPTNEA
jgi:hypothetical protein